jgi:putative transposase
MKQGVSRRAVNAGLIQEVLWEPGRGHDRNITSHEARQHAIGYIHLNPVRKELCTDILEYKWSSARTLVVGEVGDIDVDGSESLI